MEKGEKRPRWLKIGVLVGLLTIISGAISFRYLRMEPEALMAVSRPLGTKTNSRSTPQNSIEKHQGIEQKPCEPQNSPNKISESEVDTTKCWILAQELTGWSDPNLVRVIDLRSIVKFSARRIPRSFNLKPFEIKALPFSSEPILLISEPYRRREPETLCSELRQLGFTNIRALQDGVEGWANAGSSLEGSQKSVKESPEISVNSLFEEITYQRWNLFLIGQPQDLGLDTLAHIQMYESVDEALTELKALRSNEANAANSTRTAIISRSELEEQRIKSTLSNLGISNTFVLSGGIKALDRYIKDNSAMLMQLRAESERNRCK